MRTSSWTYIAAALAMIALVGCKGATQANPNTGILVVVRSDLSLGDELARVAMETVRHDGEHRIASVQVERKPKGDAVALPFSFVVYAGKEEIAHGVELVVSGYAPSGLDPMVRRRADLTFMRGKILRLVLDLARACEDRYLACEAMDETCAGNGTCIDPAIDPRSLKPIQTGDELEALPLFPKATKQVSSTGGEQGASPAMGSKQTGAKQMVPMSGGSMVDDGSTPLRMTFDSGVREGGVRDSSVPNISPVDGGIIIDSIPLCQDGEKRCMSGALYSCIDEAFTAPVTCAKGCYEGTAACNDCEADQVQCIGSTRYTCNAGFWAFEASCDLGCSSLEPVCIECFGPAQQCGDESTLQSCQQSGLWASSQCYDRCLDPNDPDADAGIEFTDPMCAPCNQGELRCTGRDILMCDENGLATSRGCCFGCDTTSICREDTALGQTMIMVVVD